MRKTTREFEHDAEKAAAVKSLSKYEQIVWKSYFNWEWISVILPNGSEWGTLRKTSWGVLAEVEIRLHAGSRLAARTCRFEAGLVPKESSMSKYEEDVVRTILFDLIDFNETKKASAQHHVASEMKRASDANKKEDEEEFIIRVIDGENIVRNNPDSNDHLRSYVMEGGKIYQPYFRYRINFDKGRIEVRKGKTSFFDKDKKLVNKKSPEAAPFKQMQQLVAFVLMPISHTSYTSGVHQAQGEILPPKKFVPGEVTYYRERTDTEQKRYATPVRKPDAEPYVVQHKASVRHLADGRTVCVKPYATRKPVRRKRCADAAVVD